MNRPLPTIPVSVTAINKLRERGYHYYEDVVDNIGVVSEVKPFLHEHNLDDRSAWSKLTAAPPTTTSLDYLQDESAYRGIVTWCKALDELLGDGMPIKCVTELCGPPGCGKTQLCLQLCVDVQIPKCFGGLGGEAVFIDTASGFCPERLRGMAEACTEHCARLEGKDTVNENQNDVFPSKILNGVHFISTHGISQLLAAVKLLPDLLKQHSEIRLVVIDSIAFPFICVDSVSTIDRTAYLYRILSDLGKLAQKGNVAVVLTNQLTTHLSRTSGERKSELSPALGESFGHRINHRIVLGRISNGVFAASVLKGKVGCDKPSEVFFRITREGIRDY